MILVSHDRFFLDAVATRITDLNLRVLTDYTGNYTDYIAQRDARKAELVKLRYFGGLTIEETAAALGISVATAKRWWEFSRAWLNARMTRE